MPVVVKAFVKECPVAAAFNPLVKDYLRLGVVKVKHNAARHNLFNTVNVYANGLDCVRCYPRFKRVAFVIPC